MVNERAMVYVLVPSLVWLARAVLMASVTGAAGWDRVNGIFECFGYILDCAGRYFRRGGRV
jgi:hypothetical protein